MARIYPLFSSSKGNAVFVGTPECGILIDCGVSARRLTKKLEECGIPIAAIQGIFITHDHMDHVSGLRVFVRKNPVTVYAEPVTRKNLYAAHYLEQDAVCEELTGTIRCGGITVTPFATSHDTSQSCGYRLEMPDGRCCAVCTDLGYVSETVHAAILGCHLVLLEANYDADMLRRGPYPPYLKERIASQHGHLSNEECGAEAASLIAGGTTHFVLGHLSQENNLPAAAEQTVMQYLSGYQRGKDYLLDVAAPESEGRMIVF
ncbi:MAG: MBL fold metallo-hydrolase [Oscillospiraceae bacterium]|nr:MBL fold metallo-hydrolase [Oscillospiraceae bacterium]